MLRIIFLGILPIVLASTSINNCYFTTPEYNQNLISHFWFVFFTFLMVTFMIYLIIQLFKSTETDEGKETIKIITFSFVSLSLFCLFIAIINEISQIDDPKLSIQPIRLNTKDIIAYSNEAIKFRNPNLTDKEIEIIKDELTFMEYLPVFIEFKNYKNNLTKQQREADIEAYEKAEQEKELKEEQEARAEQERRKQIKKDFLSKK